MYRVPGAVRAKVKERPSVEVRDVAAGGRPVRLVWKKPRWVCPDRDCPKGSWRETSEQIRPRAVLTEGLPELLQRHLDGITTLATLRAWPSGNAVSKNAGLALS